MEGRGGEKEVKESGLFRSGSAGEANSSGSGGVNQKKRDPSGQGKKVQGRDFFECCCPKPDFEVPGSSTDPKNNGKKQKGL